MRLLHRPRHETNVPKLVKLAVVGNPLFRPKPSDDVNAFFEPGSALIHTDAENVELLWDKRPAESRIEPAVADIVEHSKLAGELDRIVESGDNSARDQTDAARACGKCGQKHDRVWAVAAIVVKVVFDGLNGCVSQLIRPLR